MRFVFIYPQLKNLTGAQRLILELAGAVTTGSGGPHKVVLLHHTVSPSCRAAVPPGVMVRESGFDLNRARNHYLISLLEYLSIPFLLRRFSRIEKKVGGKIDAICFFGPPSLPGLWWARNVKRLKIPLLYFCYEPPRAAYTDINEVSKAWAGKLGWLVKPLFRLYRPIDRYLARQANVVLVNGKYGRGLVQEIYGLEAVVITHGADLQPPADLETAVAEIKKRYGLENRRVILTVNHLHPRKRINLQLEAFARLVKVFPDAALLVVGKGPEAGGLKTQAQELGIEKKVVFAGFVPDEELFAFYKAAEVYLHTGRAESFGLSVLEASAAGLPVVAVDEGGPRDILYNGETGFLVPATPDALVEKLGWLLTYRKEAAQMGEAGAARVRQHFTWSEGARNFLKAVNKNPVIICGR
jgi:glycosyltransferase involved in cell wall biosynthesis